MKEINSLSLFNGMGCLWIASELAGIKINKAYSSEIEKWPNKANDAMFPNTIQIGDVRKVDVSNLDFIDFLAGGSPCQSFSFAGKRKGMAAKTEENELIEILTLEHYLQLKEEEFEFEGQSYLFWEFIRILTDIRKYNPDVKFLLENVIMGKKWQKIITQAIGINPIRINAALVSAQNRDRLFWTNIFTEQDGFFGDLKCAIPQPKDEGILLKDILEKPEDFESFEAYQQYMKKYFLSEKALNYINKPATGGYSDRLSFMNYEDKQKSTCITANHHKGIPYNMITINNANYKWENGTDPLSYFDSKVNIKVHNTMPRSSKTGKGGTGHLSRTDGKTYCLDTGTTNAVEICVAMRGRNPENPKSRKIGLPTEQQIEPRTDGKRNCLTSVQKDNLVMQINPSTESGGKQPYQHNRIYDAEGIAPCLNTDSRSPIIAYEALGCDYRTDDGIRIRESGKSGTLTARARNDESCGQLAIVNKTIRRLTPRECGRLQSVPEDKIDIMLSAGISDTQLYKMFGNGWNIKVISHILKHLKI